MCVMGRDGGPKYWAASAAISLKYFYVIGLRILLYLVLLVAQVWSDDVNEGESAFACCPIQIQINKH